MSKVLILQNAAHFTAGSFEDELKRREIEFEYRRVYEGGLPNLDQVKNYSGIIVLGGPLSFRVDRAENNATLSKEIFFLRACLEAHKPIIAVGQGSNLLAQAQGVWVERLPLKEIGWISGEIYEDYTRNSVVYQEVEEKKIPIFCWYDTINGLPLQGYWYMLSQNCRYQSTGIHGNCYLFNFHPEVTEELINTWLKEYGKELGSPEQIALIKEQTQANILFTKRFSRRIIHAFQSFLK